MRKLKAFLALPGAERRAFLEAWAWVCTSKLALSLFGLSRTLAWYQRALAPAATAEASRPASWIGIAARNTPGGASCLVRSLALLGLLHRGGTAAELRVGVGRTAPRLEAHAWVEVDGMPINDDADVATRYPPFPGSLLGARFAP